MHCPGMTDAGYRTEASMYVIYIYIYIYIYAPSLELTGLN